MHACFFAFVLFICLFMQMFSVRSSLYKRFIHSTYSYREVVHSMFLCCCTVCLSVCVNVFCLLTSTRNERILSTITFFRVMGAVDETFLRSHTVKLVHECLARTWLKTRWHGDALCCTVIQLPMGEKYMKSFIAKRVKHHFYHCIMQNNNLRIIPQDNTLNIIAH